MRGTFTAKSRRQRSCRKIDQNLWKRERIALKLRLHAITVRIGALGRTGAPEKIGASQRIQTMTVQNEGEE
jgi:hypothetical protein